MLTQNRIGSTLIVRLQRSPALQEVFIQSHIFVLLITFLTIFGDLIDLPKIVQIEQFSGETGFIAVRIFLNLLADILANGQVKTELLFDVRYRPLFRKDNFDITGE